VSASIVMLACTFIISIPFALPWLFRGLTCAEHPSQGIPSSAQIVRDSYTAPDRKKSKHARDRDSSVVPLQVLFPRVTPKRKNQQCDSAYLKTEYVNEQVPSYPPEDATDCSQPRFCEFIERHRGDIPVQANVALTRA